MIGDKCSCYICFVCVLRVAYSLGIVAVLSADPSTYVEIPTFCTSEWLRSFNFVISFYLLVSF
jgi:hypothetical protein